MSAEPSAVYPEITRSRIAELAHQIYERRGREHGHDQEDWFAAELMVEDQDRAGCSSRGSMVSDRSRKPGETTEPEGSPVPEPAPGDDDEDELALEAAAPLGDKDALAWRRPGAPGHREALPQRRTF